MKIGLGLVAVIVVVVIVLGGAGFYALSLQSGGKSTTTSTAVPAPNLKQQFVNHINTISTRDVTAVLLDYQDSAVVTWTGHAAGLEGVYQGTGNIRLLYASALSTATTINFVPHSVIQTNESNSQAQVNSTITFTGSSSLLGSFNGNLVSSTVYSSSGGSWKILTENWNYLVFNATSKGGATTFPEWQKIGPINPAIRSDDWLHNFVWDYGGYAVAIAVYAIIIAIGVALLVRRVMKHP